jgi:hypothetical protein
MEGSGRRAWGQHRGTGLLQDLQLGEVDHLGGHVHVADGLSDEIRFSWKVARFLSVCSRGFCTDPKVDRLAL